MTGAARLTETTSAKEEAGEKGSHETGLSQGRMTQDSEFNEL